MQLACRGGFSFLLGALGSLGPHPVCMLDQLSYRLQPSCPQVEKQFQLSKIFNWLENHILLKTSRKASRDTFSASSVYLC
jgi:hypothetical protein